MINPPGRIRLVVVASVCGAMAWLATGGRAEAQGAGLNEAEKRGKQIYLKGEDARGEMKAVLGQSDLELPASSFACSNCHGLKGEGTREGGIQPPALDWKSLTQKHTSTLTGRERPAYNEAGLARAISVGVDSAGGRLHPGMPHYKMRAEQMADLVAYLKKIGNELDVEPGVGEDRVKVGAALPLTGPLARMGEDIKAALVAYFNEINSQGGVYGRRFELAVEDSRGESAGTLEATRRLVEREGVFALVGSFEPKGSAATNEFLMRSQVPLVGPVTLSPELPAVPNPYVFYLLPSFGDQARALVDFIGSDETRPRSRQSSRLAVIYSDSDFDQDGLAGLKAQAKLYGMEIVSERRYRAGELSAAAEVSALVGKKPDYVFFFGGAEDFVSLAREVEQARLDAVLLSSAVMIGRGAFSLPATIARRTYLSYPASIPSKDDFTEFLAVMQKGGVSLGSAAFQAVAYAAGKVLVEAAKSSSRLLDRAGLVASLEQLRNFRTGVVPPLSFGPNRRVGATGSYIVGIDLNSKQYVPLSDRLVPKNSSR